MVKGKGVFIWQLWRCANNDPVKLARQAKDAGYSYVAIKCADGDTLHNEEEIDAAIVELRKQDIDIVLWQYVYGGSIGYARKEALLANKLIAKHKPDTWWIDAEAWYKKGLVAVAWAKTYCVALRKNLPIGLTSYRFPTLHRKLPWKTFLSICDHHVPQVYWVGAHNPADQLDRSIRELKALKDIPFVPVGAAYAEGGWKGPTVDEINEFNARAQEIGVPAICWWDWQHMTPDWWNAIAGHVWDGTQLPPYQVEINIPEGVKEIDIRVKLE